MSMFGGGGSGGPRGEAGPDLEVVETEQLGFVGLTAEGHLKLLPTPWPADNLPPVTASLLSVAPNRGLLAAASPDTLVLAATESVRNSLRSGGGDGSGTKAFTAQASLPIPRVSHVAFSADESCMILAAEQGGGLAVYNTDAVTNGAREAQLQISTNGVSIRHLEPNPARGSWEQVAIVLSTGQLLLADLKQKELVKAASGNAVFAENVYCAAWSRLGKQLVVGMFDGTARQIDMQGAVKAEIPAPPQLQQQLPCTSIFWLDTFIFLTVHGPSEAPKDGDLVEPPTWHFVSRDKQSGNCQFRRVEDTVPPGFDARLPPNHYMQRIKDWQPHIEDCLLVACSGAADVGLITKAKEPLQKSHDRVTETISPHYSATMVPDHRRAQLPISVMSSDDAMAGGGDTFPIGFSLDASVTENAPKPFMHEQEPSQKPLPALLALNQEGMLQAWYVVYTDNARQALPFPGSVAAGLGEQGTFGQNSGKAAANTTQNQTAPQSTQGSAFGNIQQPTPFGKPSTPAAPAFGQTGGPGLGGTTPAPSFGGTSMLGPKPSMWGGGGAQKPAFGQAGGATFGSPSTPGQGQSATAQPFGSSASGGGSGLFGAGMASGGGFAQLGANGGQSGSSVFGFTANPQSEPQRTPAGQSSNTNSLFGGGMGQSNGFAGAAQDKTASNALFGASSANSNSSALSPFGSLAKADNQKPASPFGAPKHEPSFASTATLGSTSGGGGSTIGSFGKPSQPSREETMSDDDGTTTGKPAEDAKKEQPSSVFGGKKTGFDFTGFKLGSTFQGDGSAKDDLPKPKDGGDGAFKSMFGSSLDDAPSKRSEPEVKKEPGTEEHDLKDIPEAPLPPDPSSANNEKPTQKADEVPLPPMWAPGETKKAFPEDAPLPPDPSQSQFKKEDSDLPPIAGSPPVDLGREKSSQAESSGGQADAEEAGPPEEESGGEWTGTSEDGEEADGSVEDDEEGSDEDGEEDDEPSDHVVQDQKGLDSFMSRITPASPQKEDDEKDKAQQKTPETERKNTNSLAQSYTPAGLPPSMSTGDVPESAQSTKRNTGMPQPPAGAQFPAFQPPRRESPRSPSPTRREARNVTSPSRLGQQAQLPKPPPSFASHSPAIPPSGLPQATKQMIVPAQQPVQQQASLANGGVPAMPQGASKQQAQPDMDDPEHDANVEHLECRPELLMDVPNFIAHTDHVGESEKEGILGSMEKVLRDINSMIDVIGLNAHNLAGFVAAHEELPPDGERRKEDLSDPESWCFDEIADIEVLQRDIENSLDDGKLDRVPKIIDGLKQDEADMAQLKRRAREVRKQIKVHTDPERRAQQYMAPLPPESQAQQTELRESVKRVQALLAKGEDAMSLLRADLASLPAQKAATTKGNRSNNVPTVEAVENTIRKMTSMIERKGADIDVLEAQMRRLPPSVLSSMSSLRLEGDYEDDLVSAMKGSRFAHSTREQGSPYSTPPPSGRTRMTVTGDPLGMSGMLGSSRFRTPPNVSLRASTRKFDTGASALGMSTASFNGSASIRKKMRDVTGEEVQHHHAKVDRRRRVMQALKDGVEQVGSEGRIVRAR